MFKKNTKPSKQGGDVYTICISSCNAGFANSNPIFFQIFNSFFPILWFCNYFLRDYDFHLQKIIVHLTNSKNGSVTSSYNISPYNISPYINFYLKIIFTTNSVDISGNSKIYFAAI